MKRPNAVLQALNPVAKKLASASSGHWMNPCREREGAGERARARTRAGAMHPGCGAATLGLAALPVYPVLRCGACGDSDGADKSPSTAVQVRQGRAHSC